MKNLRANSGVTLITLVITIIIIVILAGIGISQISRGNIIENAQNAVDRYNSKAGEDQEEITQLDALLSQYTNGGAGGSSSGAGTEGNSGGSSSSSTTPASTEATTSAELQYGDWVKYDTGNTSVGDNGVISCRVLYNDETNGLQIISAWIVGPQITFEGMDWDIAKADYNNAIHTLNEAASPYCNSTYAYDYRCVGSFPEVNANGTYKNKDKEEVGPVTHQFTYTGSSDVTGFKDGDTNATYDYNNLYAMVLSNGDYWLASRLVMLSSSNSSFCVRAFGSLTSLTAATLCSVSTRYVSTTGMPNSAGLRPCFSLKSDLNITGGNGKTEATAYTLGV